jgi:hydrogenase maturation protease
MKIALIGAGTVIYQDEGVGVFATKYIESNYNFNKDITVVDGGVLGFQLMTYYQEFDRVIILDTITMDDSVGSIYNLPSDELLGLGSYKQTAHEVEIVEMLEICSLLEKMAIVNIIGIVPKDIETVGVGLTNEIKTNFYQFVQTALDELTKIGVSVSKNENEVALETIILNYKEPKAPRFEERIWQ